MPPLPRRPHVRTVSIDEEPAPLFARLADREGAVFLDSAGFNAADPISIIAFDPKQILRGHLDQPDSVHDWLEANRLDDSPDAGIPLGGAFGWVEYEGRFTFGLYRKLLVYRHSTQTWIDVGGLAEELPSLTLPTPDSNCPPVTFRHEMERDEYCARVAQIQEYIGAGDIYQANLSQRFFAPWHPRQSAFRFYDALRSASPAPHGAFLNLAGRQVLSASPEQFLRLSGREIQTRPIKGTRPRFHDPDRDERSRFDLITSDKEVAELIMITDLERNDLGQICEFGSVHASELLKLEAFEQVFHLVSTVRGTLRREVTHLDALRACFPGGSITGAPKKRAMEIIDELEPVERGVYTGAIGYLGLNGESQFNIAIRTAVVDGDRIHFHAGAGIVADSDPAMEYEETLHKASGMFHAARLMEETSDSRCLHARRGQG